MAEERTSREKQNTPPRPPRGVMMRGPKKIDKNTVKRLLGYFKKHKLALFIVLLMIILGAAVSVLSSMFWQYLIRDYIEPLAAEYTSELFAKLVVFILTFAAVYLVGVLSTLVYSQIMAIVAHKILREIRDEMFEHMQTIPVKYFDEKSYGDIMSFYTNDTDTLNFMVAQTVPQTISSVLTLLFAFFSMLSISVWLTIFVILYNFGILMFSKNLMFKSGDFFVKQQTSMAKVNGFVEEMAEGQKVIKVFNHEKKFEEEFDERNGELKKNATKANVYAGIMGPIMNATGQILYVLVALIGGFLAISNTGVSAINYNLTLTGMNALDVGAIVSFLTLTKTFSRPLNQMAQQVNSIASALAGATRIFAMIDEKSEVNDGYVTLVRAKKDENGEIVETTERTGMWAWKHPHSADNTITYTELKGDIRMENVDFAYVEGETVLHDISLYAKPGQKVAFVGATGAGKTTITNLINRFYDIEDGKIRYDGININKINKVDLRHSLGIVLQDVNLFTGTVMENIRYGKLDATDEECIAAAKLANADGFIRMLPDGYNTVLTGDGSGLSQGQRQLISIARAAVADPPVMILDEATSSIDTRTEAIVQKGMDALMEGRTVFVIAHRLSTVRNSNVIIVLDHGRIIERGTHDQLLEQKGTYWKLYTGAFELE